MKYETFDQPAYGVGDLETFGITDNSGSLVMDYSSGCGMESWNSDGMLSRGAMIEDNDLNLVEPPEPENEGGGGGGGGGSDDDDDDCGTTTTGSTTDSNVEGKEDEEDTVIIKQGYDPTVELTQELLSRDTPYFVYQTEFGKLLEDYSERINAKSLVEEEGSFTRPGAYQPIYGSSQWIKDLECPKPQTAKSDPSCDIKAWNAAIENDRDPRGQNGERWDGNGKSAADIYELYPENRNIGKPPEGTDGFAFYIKPKPSGGEPTHLEYYDNTDSIPETYTRYQTNGFTDIKQQKRNVSDKKNNNWVYIPLPKLYKD